MLKIIFFHGFGGAFSDKEKDKWHRLFKERCKIEFICPTLDYEFLAKGDKFFESMQSAILNQKINGIAGLSMGGNLAYHLANSLGIPALCINPALAEKTLSYKLFNKFHNYTSKLAPTNIILSEKDDLVDTNATQIFLMKNHNNYTIKIVQQPHSVDNKTLFESIGEFAKTLEQLIV